jgi:hypothetical protein
VVTSTAYLAMLAAATLALAGDPGPRHRPGSRPRRCRWPASS